MNVTLSELQAKNIKTIDLLEIISMEGRYYMARLHLDDGVHILSHADGSALLYNGTWAIQDDLHAYDARRTEVLPPAGYDEMVGMPDAPSDAMRVPVHQPKRQR